jgi:L-threonylcarbamoyladenylate synthase
VFAAKGRPQFNPLIVQVFDAEQAAGLVKMSEDAVALSATFWPGPLTLVLPRREAAGVSYLVSAGLPSLAVRVPQHPVAQAILRGFGGPVAAPSANPSGRVSPTCAAHVMAGLGGRIAAVVDGGDCPVGVESTIVDLTGPVAVLLREGGVTEEALRACLFGRLRVGGPVTERPTAPGQLASHYAPQGVVRLDVRVPEPGETYLGFGPIPEGVEAALNLSPEGDLVAAAARLFQMLHALDAMGAGRIAVAPVPEEGLGRAINDRLRRAAAPRG